MKKKNASTHVGVDAVVKHSDSSFRELDKMFAFESIKGWIDELRASALMEQGKTAEEILTINRRREKVMMQVGESTKESQVRNSIARLLNSVEDLNRFINNVEGRFASVLRSEAKGKCIKTEPSKDTEELVPFATELNKIVPAINLANERLRSILERCEL